ncbi:restriction endonuclease subunit S [Sinorhizobium medicae]|uniref:restriction endonuclease subunit S n=1 Tax=Sinorhizobium medicae TaxID=110321 RepID=UPI000420FFB9|nr:restriction endonuclease subunit S [Sinorhizobium medicae]RVQ72872.1 restriction endonuclease subunit S [Sinorhizobium medicae]
MSDPKTLLVENLDIWTSAIERKNGAGRGNGGKLSLQGIDKLRGLILDLAVRGRLVPQDPKDEPASMLLAALTKQLSDPSKRHLVSRFADAGNLSQSAQPFGIPDSWEWVRVAKLGHNWGQAEPKSEFTYIDVGAIDQKAGKIIEPQVLQASAAPSRARKIVKPGSVIYSTVRPYLLNIAIVDEEFEPEPISSTAFAVVHPFEGVDASYIYSVFRSPFFVKYVEKCQTGIAYPAINDKQFYNAPVPLPPLAEQKRIVAKVNELWALCDALEAGTRDAIAVHEALVHEVLVNLQDSRDAGDLAANWSHIETHFDALFITEESIDTLKQTILNLAVRGKLVMGTEQPSDCYIYDRSLPRASDIPFSIPKNWRWARLSTLGEMKGGGTPSKSRSDFWDGSTPWVSPKDMKIDFLADAQLHITEEAIAVSSAKLIAPKSLLFVVRGMILAHSFPAAVNLVPVAINKT